MLTDSKALFDVVTRARYTTERRLVVVISATREAYNQGINEVCNIGLISSDDNPADGLTKISSSEALKQLMKTYRLSHTVL